MFGETNLTINKEQKTALLTGASRGIGHATVKRFNADGWRVLTCQFCRENQIRQTFSCPYSQFQNQTAEQAVRLVKQGGRRNMLESNPFLEIPRSKDDQCNRSFPINSVLNPFLGASR